MLIERNGRSTGLGEQDMPPLSSKNGAPRLRCDDSMMDGVFRVSFGVVSRVNHRSDESRLLRIMMINAKTPSQGAPKRNRKECRTELKSDITYIGIPLRYVVPFMI